MGFLSKIKKFMGSAAFESILTRANEKKAINKIRDKASLLNLNITHKFTTDVATLAILDPIINRPPIETEAEYDEWWLDFDTKCPDELKKGDATFINLGGDGTYKIRITGKDYLSELEKQYCVSTLKNNGVKVTSGFLHIGAAEYVTLHNIKNKENTITLELPLGEYDLTLYGIDGIGDEYHKIREKLPNIVLVIVERTQKFKFVRTKQEIFPSLEKDPALQPTFKVGDCLKSGVKINHQHELYLNYVPSHIIDLNKWPDSLNSWPYDYKVILKDMIGLESLDYIVVKIESIHPEEKIMYCSLVEKLKEVKRSYS